MVISLVCAAWIRILAPAFISHVTLGKLSNLSGPCFLHLSNGANYSSYVSVLMSNITVRKELRIVPGTYLAVNISFLLSFFFSSSLLSTLQLMLFQWVGRPIAVQTESSAVASASEHGQIPMSCQGLLPNRAECWLCAQSPGHMRLKAGLLGVHRLQLLTGWCPDPRAGG